MSTHCLQSIVLRRLRLRTITQPVMIVVAHRCAVGIPLAIITKDYILLRMKSNCTRMSLGWSSMWCIKSLHCLSLAGNRVQYEARKVL